MSTKKIYQKRKYRLPLQRGQKKRFTFFCKNLAVFASENPQILFMQVCKDVQKFFRPRFRSRLYFLFCTFWTTTYMHYFINSPFRMMEIYTMYTHNKMLWTRWIWKFYAHEKLQILKTKFGSEGWCLQKNFKELRKLAVWVRSGKMDQAASRSFGA